MHLAFVVVTHPAGRQGDAWASSVSQKFRLHPVRQTFSTELDTPIIPALDPVERALTMQLPKVL
jgi:hypothetical protein